MIINTPERFWSFVDKSGDCWVWTGHCNAAGYGHVSIDNRLTLAHRHAWVLERGPIPAGLCVLHRCDNPPCVRHLYLGTKADNARDRSERKRYRDDRGERHPSAKLVPAQVLEIRARLAGGERSAALARAYGISPENVYRIKVRLSWQHI